MAASSSLAQNDIKPIPGLQPGSELFEVLVGDAEIVLKGEDQSTTRDVMLNGERLVIAMIADGHTWQGRVAALQRNGRRRAP
jgi:hypothetical protein